MMLEAPIDNLFSEFDGDIEFEAMMLLAEKADKLAANIKAWRVQRGLSQGELAKILKTGQSAVSKLEDPNYARYNLLTLAKVAVALGCDLTLDILPKAPSVFVSTSNFEVSRDLKTTSESGINKAKFDSAVAA